MKTTREAQALAFQTFNEIGIIAQLAGAAFERVLPAGLSLAGFGVLNHFVRLDRESETPSQLARNFQVTKGAMTNTLQRLEAAGLVKITSDPADGRVKRVRVTRAGRVAREKSIASLTPVLADLAQRFPVEDLQQVLPILARLRQTLDGARD